MENFNPAILERNNRAHRAEEIVRTYGFAREVGFPQVNIDLIAGMIGETDENWAHCIERTLELGPDSVTIYQMEVPYNTTIYRRMKDGGRGGAGGRLGHQAPLDREAFAALGEAGFEQSSAYTAYRGGGHELPLPGLPLARRGHAGPRRLVLLAPGRRSTSRTSRPSAATSTARSGASGPSPGPTPSGTTSASSASSSSS